MQGYKQFTDLVVTRFRLSERGLSRRHGVGSNGLDYKITRPYWRAT
jgi:hypothetical protein